MLYWIYDVPALLVLVMLGALFVGTCWLGIIYLCPRIRHRLHTDSGLNEILGDFLQYFGVIYGLLLGLLAVSTYQNHEDAERAVSNEASALAALEPGGHASSAKLPRPLSISLACKKAGRKAWNASPTT